MTLRRKKLPHIACDYLRQSTEQLIVAEEQLKSVIRSIYDGQSMQAIYLATEALNSIRDARAYNQAAQDPELAA